MSALDRLRCLNSYHLKILALITMVIDHVGFIFFPEILGFRIIGRIAFILYAYMIVEGFFHSKDIKKYAERLLLWAFLSEIPYDLTMHKKVIYLEQQNIFFTLFIGLIGVSFLHKNRKNIISQIIGAVVIAMFAVLMNVDYSWFGVLLIFTFYWFRNFSWEKLFLGQSWGMIYAYTAQFYFQLYTFMGLIPIAMYNGERGKKIGRIYYSFYAGHLLLLYLISKLLMIF